MGNDSSKAAENALRDDSDFQEVSLPSSSSRGSPINNSGNNDLLSYSGVLVERPVLSTALDGMVDVPALNPSSVGATTNTIGTTTTSSGSNKPSSHRKSFSGGAKKVSSPAEIANRRIHKAGHHSTRGDVSTAPMSTALSPGSGGLKKVSSAPDIANRRILKAAHPKGDVSAAMSATPSKGDNDDDDGKRTALSSGTHKKQHLPPVLSPKADSDLLEESMEHAKHKRLEKLSKTQKSNRDKAIEEKRRKGTTSPSTTTPTPQPNPFSKFLSAFSVKASHPKRSYEEGESDKDDDGVEVPVEGGGANVGGTTTDGALNSSKRLKLQEGENDNDDRDHDDATTSRESRTSNIKSYDEPSSSLSLLLSSFFSEPMSEWLPMVTVATGMAVAAVLVALRVTSSSSSSSRL